MAALNFSIALGSRELQNDRLVALSPPFMATFANQRTDEGRKERCLSLQSRAELAQKGFNGMMAMAVARTPTPIMPSLSPFAMDAPRREGLLTPLMHSPSQRVTHSGFWVWSAKTISRSERIQTLPKVEKDLLTSWPAVPYLICLLLTSGQ